MPVSAARKARTRAEIFDHAARLFRLRGYAGTSIDDIMLAAGLTRGAFYAHFASKDDLFAEVIRAGHGLLAKVRASDVKAALTSYFDKAELVANVQGCTLAALPGDAARAPLAARLAYATALYALIGELARGRRRRLDPVRRRWRSWPSAPSSSHAPRATHASAIGCCGARDGRHCRC